MIHPGGAVRITEFMLFYVYLQFDLAINLNPNPNPGTFIFHAKQEKTEKRCNLK